MVAGLTYATYTTELALLAVVAESDPNFMSNLPSCIDYAELRIYQDLQLLSTVTPRTGYSLVASQSTLQFPMGDFIVLQDVNIITPVGVSNPDAGTRNPLIPVSKEFLQFVYGSPANAGLPRYFAMLNQNTIIMGPFPDANYSAELIGTVRPPSLSNSNQTTFLSTYLPSLFLMASMVQITGYQRNFGKMGSGADQPDMGVTYENQYKALLNSAGTEEAMKKFQSSGWTSQAAAPVASPPRA